jgi:hypothetical protein
VSTIARFTLVQINDVASDGHAVVIPWTPTAYEQPGLATAHKILGVTMTTSEFTEPISVMRRGTMRGVTAQNSETWAAGDLLWARDDGSITKTRPAAPLPLILVGTVFEVIEAACTVDVDVRVLPSIGELSGVSVESPSDLDVLIYKASTHLWEPRRLAGGDVSNTAAGNLVATDMQAAINELDSEKAALAGQLGGSVASPDVRGLRETGGPTLLTMGVVADGKYLKRDGATIVGADAAGGASALDDLTDVDAASPSDGDVLTYNSTPGGWVAAAPSGGVPTSREISTTAPLTGGGDLTADLTLGIDDFTGDAGTGGASGAVPAPPAGAAAAGMVLRADGDWAVPGTIAAGTVALSKQFVVAAPPAGSTNFPFWQTEQAVTITKVRAYMIGSGSCGVNVTDNGTDVLGANLSPSSSWGSSAGLALAVAAGRDIDVEVRGVTGTVSYVAVQIDYTLG